MANVKHIPEGQHCVTPALIVKGGRKAIAFYEAAFGAKVKDVMYGPDGESVAHAELTIGDSVIFLGDESPEWGTRSPHTLGGSPVSLNLYTEDCDAVYQRALAAGATGDMPPGDKFWGDRYAKITDPFGHTWGIATHIEDVTAEEMERRLAAEMAKNA
ncbi:MAG TPA: VOC family protein [Candidatus Eisenbacteria bacterium]|nr:VOC family protein [Candidatus Eisenbacteria bacterium]